MRPAEHAMLLAHPCSRVASASSDGDLDDYLLIDGSFLGQAGVL